MSRDSRRPGAARRGRCGRWLVLLAALAALAPPALGRELYWRELAVDARLDEEGSLWVRERHVMVFTGEWNGGERIFRLAEDHSLELYGLWRLDPRGEAKELERGSLERVDHYDWTDRRTLRWRSRLPSDPPFQETPLTYVLEYRIDGALLHRGERYRLDHDFAFPDRIWPIERFTLELELDPVWRPREPLKASYEAGRLRPGEGFVLTAELEYTGAGQPAAVFHLPPVPRRAAIFGAAALALVWMLVDFVRRERAAGRYDRPPSPAGIDRGWLEEHLLDLAPEEAGALWDRKVGPAEVAAILARWEGEGRMRSEVVPRPGMFRTDLLKLELLADRDSFDGYEASLMQKLFFSGRTDTDTDAIRQRYKNSGFDPAGTVGPGIRRRLRERDRELLPAKKLAGSGKLRTGLLLLASVVLLAIEAIGRPLLTLQLAALQLAPLAVLYLLFGLVFAHLYRGRLTHLGWWSLGFLLPGALFFAQAAGLVFFDRWLPQVDFAPQPGLAGSAALAALAAMVWSSLLNQARTRERPRGLRRRQELGAARRLLAAELRRPDPELDDRWVPHLLALGLGKRVDHWWRRFGASAEGLSRPAVARSLGGSGSSGGGWTGGGGAFGGAGATASWVAAASTVASGVARPSSGSGGSGGGGGGGGSSGGGGGGGW